MGGCFQSAGTISECPLMFFGSGVFAETLEHHGYLSSPLDYQKIGGSPLFEVEIGRWRIIVSQVRYDAIEQAPIAARLFRNILKYSG